MAKFKNIMMTEASEKAWNELEAFVADPGVVLKPGIGKEFEEYMPKLNRIVVYRGMTWWKKNSREVFKTLQINPNPKVNMTGKYTSHRIDSWTTRIEEAELFADGEANNVGDIGIIFSTVLDVKDIEVALAFIPKEIKRKYIYDFDQHEILVKPKTHQIQIRKLYGDWK